MSPPVLYYRPEAETLLYETLGRAASRSFLFEISSETAAHNAIMDTFHAAASIHESTGEGDPENPVLDLDEARLAAASLNLIVSGDRWVAADEAREAAGLIRETLGIMYQAPSQNCGYAEWLVRHDADRARGWRRIRPSFVAREIRALFRTSDHHWLDARPTLDPIDAVFVSLALSWQAGGTSDSITSSDVFAIAGRIQAATRGLALANR